MSFKQKLDTVIKKNNSLLCVGLDPDLSKFPKHLVDADEPIFEFNKHVIDVTADIVCVYKPNIAFYEAYGIAGLKQLKKTIEYLQKQYSHIPIVLDAKRGDIGNTAKMYAKAVYEYWQADAVTIFPNLGKDTIEPFLKYKDKLTILLLKTSNPDSGMFQNAKLNGTPYYLHMAKVIKRWGRDNIGIFVGAPYPKELSDVRKLFPDKIFLSAGVGGQSAEIGRAVKAGIDKRKSGIMFNASRSILFASNDKDFAQKARVEAQRLRDEINSFRV